MTKKTTEILTRNLENQKRRRKACLSINININGKAQKEGYSISIKLCRHIYKVSLEKSKSHRLPWFVMRGCLDSFPEPVGVILDEVIRGQ